MEKRTPIATISSLIPKFRLLLSSACKFPPQKNLFRKSVYKQAFYTFKL